MREYQLAHGVPRAQVYDQTMYILAGFLVLGLMCNLLVRPVADKYFMTDAELAHEKRLAHERDVASAGSRGGVAVSGGATPAVVGRRVAGGRHPADARHLDHAAEGDRAVQVSAVRVDRQAVPTTG